MDLTGLLIGGLIIWCIRQSTSIADHATRIKTLESELADLRSQLDGVAAIRAATLPLAAPVTAPVVTASGVLKSEPPAAAPTDVLPEPVAQEAVLPARRSESVFETLRRPRHSEAPAVTPVSEAAPRATQTTRARRVVARPAPVSISSEQLWQALAGPLGGHRGDGDGAAEMRLGTVWLSRIGVLLLLIGAVFAYRYGVTTNALRAVVGYAAGLALLALGYWGNRRGFAVWAQAMSGGGLGLLYLTTTAGSAYFVPPVIPQPLGFVLMILITTLGTGLAVLYNAQAIGLLSLIGGFATPFLLSTGHGGNMVLLFAYVAVLAAGLLLVAAHRRWPLYNYLVFAATWGTLGLWRFFAYTPADRGWALAFASVYFLTFNLVSLAPSLLRRQRSGPSSLALMTINALIYFGSGLLLIEPGYTIMRGFFAFAVAAVFAGLSLALLRRNRTDRLMVLASLGLAALFLTIAFPVALNGSWITAAWAIEGALLVWLGLSADLPGVSRAGLIVLTLAAGRLMTWDTLPRRFGQPLPAPGLRAFTFISTIGAFYAAARARWPLRRGVTTRAVLTVAGSLVTLWYLTLEVFLHYQGLVLPPGELWADRGLMLSVVWAVYGLVLSLADLRFGSQAFRRGARIVLGTALAMLPAACLPGTPSTLMGYVGLGVPLIAVWAAELSFRRRKVGDAEGGILSLAANVIAFAAVALQTSRVMAARLSPAIGEIIMDSSLRSSTLTHVVLAVMAGYALLAMLTGIVLRARSARALAGLFALVTIGGAAILAVPHGEAPLALRLVTFLLIVPGTYLAIWAARRSSDGQSPLEVRLLGAVGLAATTLTAWWGTSVIRQLTGPTQFWYPATVWLGLYAVAVGLAGRRLRLPAVRLLARVLQLPALLVLFASGNQTASWAWRLGGVIAAVVSIYAADWLFAAGEQNRLEAGLGRTMIPLACLANLAWAARVIAVSLPIAHQQPAVQQSVTLATRYQTLAVFVGAYGLIAGLIGLWRRRSDVRWLGLALQGLALAGLIIATALNCTAPAWLRGVAYVVCVGGLYLTSWRFGRSAGPLETGERTVAGLLPLAGAGLTVIWLAFQVNEYFRPFLIDADAANRALTTSTVSFGISAVWGLYGLLVLAIGFGLRHRATRLLGLATLVLTLAKIGAYDMWKLATRSRIWVTIGLGVVFVVASLLYTRYRRIVMAEFRKEEAQ